MAATNICKCLVSIYPASVVIAEGKMLEVDTVSGALEAAVDTLALSEAATALIEAADNKKRALLIVPVNLGWCASVFFETSGFG